MKCEVSKYLAYSMSIYTMASIYYWIISRTVGTPFNDSLSDEQKHIKEKSANVRKSIFFQGILISLCIIYITKPFKSC